jgi:hypothetical protein
MMTIETVLASEYGVSLLWASPEVILWAADRVADEVGVEHAKAELKRVNQKRDRAGRVVLIPGYGHRLF